MNAGKQFEKDFKASVLDDQFFLRLNDAGGWSKSADLRFTPSQQGKKFLEDMEDV